MNLPTKICAIALAIAAGFGVGRSLRSPAAAPTGGQADTAPKTPLSALPNSLRDSKLTSWSDMMRLDHARLSTSDWQRLMNDTRGDPFLSEALVRRWAANDPASCWKYLLEIGHGWPDATLAKIASDAWAGRDPEAAIAALVALDCSNTLRKRERGALVSSAMVAAMIFDLDRGFELFATANGIGKDLMFSETWMTSDPGKVCRKLAEFLEDHPGNFTRTAGRAAGVWYGQAPEAALEWAKSQPHDTRAEALDKIADEMAEAGDYDGIRALAADVESMMILQKVGQPLRKHLQRQDPALACQWVIDTFDGRMMGAEIGNIIGTTSNDEFDPAGYVPFFEQIPEGLGKGEAAGDLFNRWAEVDLPAAAAWMSQLDRRTRNESAGSVASQWAHKPAAHEWLRSAPPSSFADSMLRSALPRLKDPAKARDFAATLPAARTAQAEEIIQQRESN